VVIHWHRDGDILLHMECPSWWWQVVLTLTPHQVVYSTPISRCDYPSITRVTHYGSLSTFQILCIFSILAFWENLSPHVFGPLVLQDQMLQSHSSSANDSWQVAFLLLVLDIYSATLKSEDIAFRRGDGLRVSSLWESNVDDSHLC